MQADDPLGPRSGGGDDVRIEIAGVGRENCVGADDRIEALEQFGLDGEVVEDGFDDDIGMRELPHIGGHAQST